MSGLILPPGPQGEVLWQSGINLSTARGQVLPGTFRRNSTVTLGGTSYPPNTPRTLAYGGGMLVYTSDYGEPAADRWSIPVTPTGLWRGSWTISAAVLVKAVSPGGGIIFAFKRWSDVLWLTINGNTGTINARRGGGSIGLEVEISTPPGQDYRNAWARAAVVFDRGLFSLYVNGQFAASVPVADMKMPDGEPIYLGHAGDGYGVNAWIAAGAPGLAIPFIRPWALTPADIAAEDARWKAALDAVTLPVT